MASDFPTSIGNPARSALEHAGYTQLEQLADVSKGEIAGLHGMGPTAPGILKATLEARGLSFSFPKGILTPALRALVSAGYTWLEQLDGVSEGELVNLHGMGPKALGQLRAALAERGLSLRGEADGAG